MELDTSVQSSIHSYQCRKLGHMQGSLLLKPMGSKVLCHDPQASGSPVEAENPTAEYRSPHGTSANGAHRGGLAPGNLGTLETREINDGLLEVHTMYLSTRNLDPKHTGLPNSSKFGPKWIGPYTVVREVHNYAYKLNIQAGNKLNPGFNTGSLKPYKESARLSKTSEVIVADGSVGHVIKSIKGKRRRKRRTKSLTSISHVSSQAQLKSATSPPQLGEDHYHISYGVTGNRVIAVVVHLDALLEVSELLKFEKSSTKGFLAELKTGEFAEIVLLKPEAFPEDVKSSSVMDEDVLQGFTKKSATGVDSEILKTEE
ncbi:LOW QUALITY PROTEIN: Hypothetical protein PHPALM_16853 [Phytophthora palmivora]|uniref:Uncharacterized protein n=1 Tax=Phytophthora palmivora TaxID=4796 RepID=A0A2P4XNR7_9STRA|nr:LOW QUALITY PROTEIN: Hypothetical protein PHPALM_16853 [Phytophthora palmivora]